MIVLPTSQCPPLASRKMETGGNSNSLASQMAMIRREARERYEREMAQDRREREMERTDRYDTEWYEGDGLTFDEDIDYWSGCRLVKRDASAGVCGVDESGDEIDAITFLPVRVDGRYVDDLYKIGDGQCVTKNSYSRFANMGAGKRHPYTREFFQCGRSDDERRQRIVAEEMEREREIERDRERGRVDL